jgi:hypothetical protein
MPDHIGAIQQRLERMIADAESRMSGNGSILSYGMKIRRDTAQEILEFIRALTRSAATDASMRGRRHRYDATRVTPRSSDPNGRMVRQAMPQLRTAPGQS